MLKGFRDFILRGNVVDLAVAVIIGAAFTSIVNSLVTDLINPLISAFGGKPDLSALTFTVHGGVFKYGAFLNALISFLIVAGVVYFFVVLPINSLLLRLRGPAPSTTKPCPPVPRRCSSRCHSLQVLRPAYRHDRLDHYSRGRPIGVPGPDS